MTTGSEKAPERRVRFLRHAGLRWLALAAGLVLADSIAVVLVDENDVIGRALAWNGVDVSTPVLLVLYLALRVTVWVVLPGLLIAAGVVRGAQGLSDRAPIER